MNDISPIQKLAMVWPIIFIVLTLIILFSKPTEIFNVDTAHYAYSAIFQGFAAILAITITIVLVSLQSLSSQIYNMEERVFKIIGHSVPKYRPVSLLDVRFYVNEKFSSDFLEELKQNPQETLHEDLVVGIKGELKRMFLFIDKLNDQEKKLQSFFKLSLVLSVIVISISLTFLVFYTNKDNDYLFVEFYDVSIESTKILYITYLVTIFSVWSFAHFIYYVLRTWVTGFQHMRIHPIT